MIVYRIVSNYTGSRYEPILLTTSAEKRDNDEYWEVSENSNHYDTGETYPLYYFKETKQEAKNAYYAEIRKQINNSLDSIKMQQEEMKTVEGL